MNIADSFTGQYQKPITLCNTLIPMGKTLENLKKHNIITADEKLEENYQQAKKIIDKFHRYFINKNLAASAIDWNDLAEAILAFQKDRSEENKNNLEKVQTAYRKSLLKEFTADENYACLFKKELFTKVLPSFCTKEELAVITSFKNFFTYFAGFNENRKNIYSTEPISTSIAYRLIHENFPKFLANCQIFSTWQKICPEVIADAENKMLANALLNNDTKLEDYFVPNSFNAYLTQDGIDRFNNIISGLQAKATDTKTQGLNEHLNLAMQQDESLKQTLRSRHAAKMYALYKQILSNEDSSLPFIDTFTNDAQLIGYLKKFFHELAAEDSSLSKIHQLFQTLPELSADNIYISGQEINNISSLLYGGSNWSLLRNKILEQLKDEKAYKKLLKDNDNAALDAKISKSTYSLRFLSEASESDLAANLASKLEEAYQTCLKAIRENDFNEDAYKAPVKNILDALLSYYHLAAVFKTDDSMSKDPDFYSLYDSSLNSLREIVYTYNKVRNHATKKAFNQEKFKLNFENSQLCGGWDTNKEKDYTSILLTKDGRFYLGIMNKNNKPQIDAAFTENTQNVYRKMVYKYFPDFSKMFIKCAITKDVKNHFKNSSDDYVLQTAAFNRPLIITKEIYDLYSTEYDGKKKFQIDYLRKTGDAAGYYAALHKWIAFALDFLEAYGGTSSYDIASVKTSKYDRLDKFYKDVNNICYKISFVDLDEKIVEQWVESGQLYLFQIYNKDFAPGRTGTKNLHTLYLENIFNEQNLKDVVIKLNGGAEIFYRRKTKGTPAVHAKDSKLVNRTASDGSTIPEDLYQEIYLYANGQKTSLSADAQTFYTKAVIKTATHDIVKDKRYYEDKFFFHFPITINYKAADNSGSFNKDVLEFLHHNPEINIIGIDRGERNLIYMTVIDQKGKILASKSFNTLIQKAGTVSKKVDYHDKLQQREAERTEARRSWETIGKIATLKEGYLSAVIHEITKAMIKYNAIVIMEDLNTGFKRMRSGIAEKAVYQKFEKMLIDKLNYLAFKDIAPSCPGGILKGYQLTCRFESFEKIGKQNGFLFYVPAAFTSKIDPTTGFSNVFNLKAYGNNTANIKKFFTAFDSITFDSKQKIFTFSFDYKNFKTFAAMHKTKWQVSSYGERILHTKTSAGYQERTAIPAEDLYKLLSGHNIAIADKENLLPHILEKDDSKINSTFWKTLFYIFQNILQMRNSSHKPDANGNETDYIISPVFNGTCYYDSRKADTSLPQDADANGAYHIALKGLMYLKINDQSKDGKPKLFIKNDAWFKFVQTREFTK